MKTHMKSREQVMTHDQSEHKGYWEPLTLGEQLRLWAAQYKDNIALVDDNSRLTYREFDYQVDERAAGFVQLGIKAGDHVVVQLPNRVSFVITCFALFRIGALPILTLPAHREADLDGIFQLTKPVAYIIPGSFLGYDYSQLAARMVKKHSSVQFVITDCNWATGLRLADISRPPRQLEEPLYWAPALLLLSGGTTGVPKLIPRTHADYVYNAKAAAARCKLTTRSIYLAVLPVAHNFPLCCPGILGTLSAGGKVVMCNTTSPDEAFPLIEQEKVTITALVPAIVNVWLEVLEWDTSHDISSLEVVQVGGSMLDEHVAKRIMPMMKCKLQQVFGMAEGLICCTDLDDPDDTIHTCQGRPLSDADHIRIVDETGNDVEPGQYGELLVKGPYTIGGYYLAPVQNHEHFTADGYYRSGDSARWTPEGNIQVGGRIKEQINRAGEKIIPSEIVSYLCAHPSIKDAVLVSLPDESLGEKVCAYLIPNNKNISVADMYTFLHHQGVASYKMPDQMEWIDGWPLTGVGKVNKDKLKQLVLERNQPKNKLASYVEEVIPFVGDAHVVAAQLAESGWDTTYLLYENGNELSLGIGEYAAVTVGGDDTTLQIADQIWKLASGTVSDRLDNAFATVPVQNWRAYGIANFELARYHYQLPSLNEDAYLLKLFIPELEVRWTPGVMLLRALQVDHLTRLRTRVQAIIEANHVPSMEPKLGSKVSLQKMDVPEVRTSNTDVYKHMVAQAVQEIRARHYHKVILSRKIPLPKELDMAASYVAGRRVNTPARSFLLQLDGLTAAGFSPETVVEVDKDGWVRTFPLAGTRSNGRNKEEEDKLREELLHDPKEIAEHAVSVKLAFEELKSVCDATSIMMSDYMSIARRGTVQHIASKLTGKLKPGYTAWHAFDALFPAVTASGIPKKEALEAIERLETEPRHLYSGCILTVDSDGTMDAALVLRTIYQQNGSAWLHAGAGVVEMSVPERELEETCEKLSSFARQLVAKQHEQPSSDKLEKG